MALRTPQLVPRGAFIMAVVVEGTSPGTTATMAQVSAWIRSAMAPYTMTMDSMDPQPTMEDFFSVPRDTFITVDLQNMQILRVSGAGGATAALADLTRRLDAAGL